MSGYDIESTPFKPVLKKIIKSGKKAVRFNYEGILHTKTENIPVTKLLTIDIVKDFATKIGDYGFIEFMIGAGTYTKRIYPNRDNLEFTIKRTELQEEGAGAENNKQAITTKYKAIFLSDQNPSINATADEGVSEDILDTGSLVTVKLQILDRSLEPLRIKTTNGVYKGTTQEQLIKSIMLHESYKVLVDGKPSVDGIDLVPPDNKEGQKHTLIPVGTKIANLPTFLQEKSRGVYSAGIGTYLQKYKGKKLWFVYPLFNTKRFNNDVPKVIFYNLPQNQYTSLDRTFVEDGKLLQVVITAEHHYKDQADADNMESGNGLRQTDPVSFMHKPITPTPDGPVAVRAMINKEYNGNDRADGLNFAPVTDTRISINPFLEQSKVIARSVGTVTMNWENADPELLYPAMPGKYVFTENNKPVELNSCLLGVHVYISLEGRGVNSNSYKTMAQLRMVTEPYSTKPKVKAKTFKGNI